MENNKIKVVDEFNYGNFMKIDKTNYIDKKPRWRIVVTLERGDSYSKYDQSWIDVGVPNDKYSKMGTV